MNVLSRKPVAVALAVPALAAALLSGSGAAHASESSAPAADHAATAAQAPVGSRNAVPPQGLPHNWVSKGSGYFRTSDPQDLLHYRVYLGAASPDVVEFRLQAHERCLWAKTLVMPDGEGNSWDIKINPSAGEFDAQNGLWAHQVRNGQRLKLWKAGFLGFQYKVLEIGDLGPLQPGSRVVFTWLKDSTSCGA